MRLPTPRDGQSCTYPKGINSCSNSNLKGGAFPPFFSYASMKENPPFFFYCRFSPNGGLIMFLVERLTAEAFLQVPVRELEGSESF